MTEHENRRRRGPRFDGGVMDIFEASRDMVCLCRGGTVAAMNQAGLRLLGLSSPTEVHGRPFASLAQGQDGSTLAAAMIDRSIHGRPVPVRLDAAGRVVNLDLQIFHAGEIGSDAAVVIGRDTSRERELADTAREIGQRFTVLVDNAMNLVCHVCDGIIRYVNSAGIATLGAETADSVIGRPLAALFHADYAGMLDPVMIECILDDGQAVPMRIRRDDGGMVDALINFTRLPSRQGRELMVEARDITATNRAVQALKHSVETLELRVAERTAELAREKEGVERANRELEAAHSHISDSIRYASRLQAALLPDPGALDGIVAELVVGWQPLDLVGGDYYWLGRFGSRAVVAVFDCTGHGVPGAFMTAVAASALARVLKHDGHDDPAEILTNLNRLVRAALRQDRAGAVSNDGLDAAICVVDSASGRLSFAGANLPLLLRSGGAFRVVRGDRIGLGYVETSDNVRFTRHDITLDGDESCYLFTDGVTDHVGGPQRRLFGRRRLVETLETVAERSLEAQMAALFRTLDDWRGDEVRRDDVTFLGFRPIRPVRPGAR